jgi:hypothetical protein
LDPQLWAAGFDFRDLRNGRIQGGIPCAACPLIMPRMGGPALVLAAI